MVLTTSHIFLRDPNDPLPWSADVPRFSTPVWRQKRILPFPVPGTVHFRKSGLEKTRKIIFTRGSKRMF